jgi:hypothetical protein
MGKSREFGILISGGKCVECSYGGSDEFGEQMDFGDVARGWIRSVSCFEVAVLLMVAKSEDGEQAVFLCAHQESGHAHGKCNELYHHTSYTMHGSRFILSLFTCSLCVAELRSQPWSDVLIRFYPIQLALGCCTMNVRATTINLRR